jgi:microcystin-dependent protein
VADSTAAPITTGVTGSGLPFDNMQPSLVVTEVIPLTGIFPSIGPGGFASGDTLGFVYSFAGNFAPGGTINAQGQLLPIVQNTAVLSLLGTTYGGNGVTTYALPDLAGRAIIGTGTGPGLSPQPLGAPTGSATASLTTTQLPSYNHTLSGGRVTGATGGNQPLSNMQPALPLHRVIATDGVYPSPGGGATFIGQLATFVGNFVPGGWAEADEPPDPGIHQIGRSMPKTGIHSLDELETAGRETACASPRRCAATTASARASRWRRWKTFPAVSSSPGTPWWRSRASTNPPASPS